ncbi:MAG: SRPBCC domain-containing protein [Bacteroidia bacterium]|nr:SRPBCC domain-containing protein [Bacteroidia bacterium]
MSNINEVKEFIITRTLKAPCTLVFKMWSQAEHLKNWWGPAGSAIEVVTLDFRTNGVFHYKMKSLHDSFGIFKFRHIDEPNSITWVNSFANEKGEIIKPPFKDLDFPKEILNTVTFSEKDGVTTLTITAKPLNATENEISTFYSLTESMQQGYGGTLDQLDNYLSSITK